MTEETWRAGSNDERDRVARQVPAFLYAEGRVLRTIGEIVDELNRDHALAQEACHELRNLLAIIHRDGGHYVTEHGAKKAVEDAHLVWAALQQEVEELRKAPNGAWRAHLGHLEQDNSLLQQEVEALKATQLKRMAVLAGEIANERDENRRLQTEVEALKAERERFREGLEQIGCWEDKEATDDYQRAWHEAAAYANKVIEGSIESTLDYVIGRQEAAEQENAALRTALEQISDAELSFWGGRLTHQRAREPFDSLQGIARAALAASSGAQEVTG